MDFKSYFQDELAYLRDAGDEFARLNPKLAKYLSSNSTDPDVAKLIEGFAYLTARLRMTLDDGLPDVTQPVLRMTWPNFVRPFPPITLMKFTPLDRSITTRHPIERGTVIRSASSEEGFCDFTTTAAFSIYPLEIAGVEITRSGVASHLRIDFATLSGLPLSSLGIEDLRLWFTGDKASAEMLYFWCRHHTGRVHAIGTTGKRHLIPAHQIEPGGFATDEALMPGAEKDFDGYRLVQEYFSYPQKFHCIDLTGLGPMFSRFGSPTFSLEWAFDGAIPSEVKATIDDIRLYCAPAVNLFTMECGLSEDTVDGAFHQVVQPDPDGEAIDIFSVDAVSLWSRNATGGDMREFIPPYASFDHTIEYQADRRQVYYKKLTRQRLNGSGLDHLVQFVRHDGTPAELPGRPVITVSAFHDAQATALVPGAIALSSQELKSFVEAENITIPQSASYPPIDDERAWKLVSNLTPLYVDIQTPEALVEVIEAYDYPAASDRQAERASRRKLKAITAIETKPIDWFFKGRPKRGLASTLTVRDSAFDTLGELYLFGQVLSEFLALYATANSFIKLEIRCTDSGEIFRYPPATGRQPLI